MRPYRAPIAERLAFRARPTRTGCLVWTGGCDSYGYGEIKVRGKMYKVHRVAWEEAHGPIPKGLKVLHTCDNPPCLKLAHLWLGTSKDNTQDMMRKGRWKGPGISRC